MSVVVDTSVWSLALRRKSPGSNAIEVLSKLIAGGEILMLGSIRQELLSGIQDKFQFERLRDRLRAFPDLALTYEDYELAAEFFNRCRNNGIQGSNTDFLICAVAYRCQSKILTTDRDFELFSSYLPIALMNL